jgi:hypothetical protein
MSLRAYRTFQGLVLAALGLFLLSKLWDGSVLLYINQRFVWLVVFAAIGLVILSQVILQNRLPARDGETKFTITQGTNIFTTITIMKLYLDGTYGGWHCLSCWGCWSPPGL